MPHRILLADDSLTIQKVIELTFSGTDFELKAVGNGDLAIPLLDSFSPDIVLADCVMPGKSGYELCEEVKRRPGGRFVPVVLLTGTFEPFDKPRAEQSGADSVVTKPFDSQSLASLVRDLVNKAAEERAAAPPEPPPAPEPPPLPEPPPVPEYEPPPSLEEERAESTDPTLGRQPFQTVPLSAMSPPPPPPEQDFYATSAIPVFREPEVEPPPDFEAETPPADERTEVLPPVPEATSAAYEANESTERLPPMPEPGSAAYEMDLGALEDEPPHRDLEADIAAFEASGRSATRPELWDLPAAKAAGVSSLAEPEPGELEALAAEASLTDLKSLIPKATAAAAPTVGPLSDDDIDRIARRVIELSGERIVRKIAWDVVPELAERLVKERLDELDKPE